MSAWRRTAYRAARPLLFAFDAEAIHHTTLDLLATVRTTPAGALPPRVRRRGSRCGARPGGGHRAALPQPRRARRGIRQGRHRHRGLGGARVRLRRARHRHAPSAGRAIRAHGSPACRATARSSTAWGSTTPAPRRWPSRIARCAAAAARGLRRRRQHRPQPRRGRRRLPDRGPRRRRRWPTISPSTSARRTRPACATSRTRSGSTSSLPWSARPRRLSRSSSSSRRT